MENRWLKRLSYLTGVLACLQAQAAFAADLIRDPKEGWDELWGELMTDIVIIGAAFAAITVYLLIRYRRGRSDKDGKGVELSPIAAFGWVVIPVFIFMADDIYLAARNFEQWNNVRTVPKGALVIEAEGYMWAWDFKYPDGIMTNNELRVPVGRPVHVKLKSRDVVHSFFIPDYRVKWDAVPGKENYIWFYPKETGEFVITCTEFCGMLHSNMYGKVIVMPEGEYNKWAEENKVKGGSV